jgi:hypothetical protein
VDDDRGIQSLPLLRDVSNPLLAIALPVGHEAAALAVTVLVTTIAESGVAETIEVVVVV